MSICANLCEAMAAPVASSVSASRRAILRVEALKEDGQRAILGSQAAKLTLRSPRTSTIAVRMLAARGLDASGRMGGKPGHDKCSCSCSRDERIIGAHVVPQRS